VVHHQDCLALAVGAREDEGEVTGNHAVVAVWPRAAGVATDALAVLGASPAPTRPATTSPPIASERLRRVLLVLFCEVFMTFRSVLVVVVWFVADWVGWWLVVDGCCGAQAVAKHCT
jgi:hypothetical protein